MPSIALNAKFVLLSAPTRDSKKSRGFYGALLGREFAHGLNPIVASWWTPLEPGVDFNVTARYDDRERLTPYFGVDDLAGAIKQLEKLGGQCVVAPRDVLLGPDTAREAYVKLKKKEGQDVRLEDAKTAGRIAVMLDPDLNHIGLMEIAPHARRHFMMGEFRSKFTAEQVAEFASSKKLADKLEAANALPKE